MSTIHAPIELICGEPFKIPGTAADINGTPLNLEGASIEWQLDDYTGEINALTLNSPADIQITDPANGAFIVNVSATATAKLAPGVYRDQLSVTLSGGALSVQWAGAIIASARL